MFLFFLFSPRSHYYYYHPPDLPCKKKKKKENGFLTQKHLAMPEILHDARTYIYIYYIDIVSRCSLHTLCAAAGELIRVLHALYLFISRSTSRERGEGGQKEACFFLPKRLNSKTKITNFSVCSRVTGAQGFDPEKSGYGGVFFFFFLVGLTCHPRTGGVPVLYWPPRERARNT